MGANQIPNLNDAFEKMDKMYRRQRYFYDLTRKYYLLGRDRLLRQMAIRDGEQVLEIGCGTGRNLIALARRFPAANFYGLDASGEMLKTARAKIEAANLKNITLQTALADDFQSDNTFDLTDSFDRIFFSYAVSIIPNWKESIENALANLKPGGRLGIVDFYDQRDLPAWFQRILKGWLARFHVRYPPDLIAHFESLELNGAGRLSVEPLYRRYAFLLEYEKQSVVS